MNKAILIFQNIFYLITFFISYISFINCLLEIPLTPIEVKGIQKYKNIKIKIPDYPKNNKTLFIDEGKTLINNNLIFLANIKIGSNNQQFNLILDTGSFVLWVPKIGSKDSAEINHHYDPSTSSTSKNLRSTFSIQYGSGSCKGYFYSDDFEYINNKKFKVNFGVADQTDFSVDNGDGIIGLGRNYEEENTSFIHMLKKYGVTDSTLFSFNFDSNKSGASGQLFIGKHTVFSSDIAKTCPLMKYKESISGKLWTCNVTGIGLKNSKIDVKSGRSFNIIFDTGTNMILLPKAYIYDIKETINSLGCEFSTEDFQSFQIRCRSINGFPDFRFEINGNTYILPKEYCFQKILLYYYSTIIFVSSSEIYTMGTPFFFAFHTLFDQESNNLHFYPTDSSNLQEGTFITEDDMKGSIYDDEEEDDDDDDGNEEIASDNGKDSGADNNSGNNHHESNDDDSSYKIILIIISIIIACLIAGAILYKIFLCYKQKRQMDYPSSNYFIDTKNSIFL